MNILSKEIWKEKKHYLGRMFCQGVLSSRLSRKNTVGGSGCCLKNEVKWNRKKQDQTGLERSARSILERYTLERNTWRDIPCPDTPFKGRTRMMICWSLYEVWADLKWNTSNIIHVFLSNYLDQWVKGKINIWWVFYWWFVRQSRWFYAFNGAKRPV